MDKETIDKAAMEYSGLTDNPKDPNARERGCLCIAFSDGAHWRINSVWHDVKEIPDTGKFVLIQLAGSERFLILFLPRKRDYLSFIKRESVIGWAYVSDLLPERKEGTK